VSDDRVAVLGAATRDEIVLADGRRSQRPGGTPHYAARALRSVGAGAVAIETGSLRSRLRHTDAGTEQSILSLPAPLDPASAARLLPRLAGCVWVHLGGQTAGDFPPETIAVLAESGLRICLDGQGLARGSRTGPVRLGPIDPAAIRGVHALKLNAAEAGAAEPVEVEELIITRAEQGCELTAAGRHTAVPANGRRFTDPTGAGDSFCALYCLARTRGADPADAAGWAQRQVERLYADGPGGQSHRPAC